MYFRVEKKGRRIEKKRSSSRQNSIEEKTIKKPKKREKKGRSRCGVGQGSPEQTETVIYLKRETNMAETFFLSSEWQKLSISEATLEKGSKRWKSTNKEMGLTWQEDATHRQFSDAPSHLYKRLCPSVRRSVRPSVGPSPAIFKRVLGASCAVYPALL